MKYFKKAFSISISILLFSTLISSCSIFKHKKNYINNDSTAIFSTHSSRPFKYGYALKKEELTDYYNENFAGFGVKNGEIVADIGGASGWIDGVISVFTDSVSFYIEDIDTNYANHDQMERVVKYYSELRDKPQTNKFQFVLGTTKLTNLPSNTFDLVILNNVYHEIKNKNFIIGELSRIIKPTGRIVICERFSNKFHKTRQPGCGMRSSKVSDIAEELGKYGFFLTNTKYPEYAFYNFLTFEKSKTHFDDFKTKKDNIQGFIDELDELNKPYIAYEQTDTEEKAQFLKSNISEIHKVYPCIDSYLNSLGKFYVEKWRYDEALNIFKVCDYLYPNNSDTYMNIGLTYYSKEDYANASSYFINSIELDSNKNKLTTKQICLDGLNQLNSQSIASDSILVRKVAQSFKDNSKILNETYDELELYISTLGYKWFDEDRYEAALNIFNINILLYPKSADSYISIGDVYVEKLEYEKALKFYTKSLEIEPCNHTAKKNIKKVMKMMKKDK